VDSGSIRNVFESAAVADFHIGSFAAHDDVADLKADWFNDVTLLAIDIADEGDEGTAVRVVFDRFDRALDAVFATEEVDDTITILVSTADVTAGDARPDCCGRRCVSSGRAVTFQEWLW
jgi:hypothetical protein